MPLEAILVLAILVGAVALFISEKFPIDFAALLVLGVLLFLGLVTPQEEISGFSNPATDSPGSALHEDHLSGANPADRTRDRDRPCTRSV